MQRHIHAYKLESQVSQLHPWQWVSIGSIYLCTPWKHKNLNILLNFNPLSFAQMSSLPNSIYRHSPSFYNVWSKQSHLHIKMSNASTLSIHEHGWSNQHKTIPQKSRYQPNKTLVGYVCNVAMCHMPFITSDLTIICRSDNECDIPHVKQEGQVGCTVASNR